MAAKEKLPGACAPTRTRTWARLLAAVLAIGAIGIPATPRARADALAAENSRLGLGRNSAPDRALAEPTHAPEMHRESAVPAYDFVSDSAYATKGSAAGGARGTTGFVADAQVVHHGKVIGRGTVDVRATVEGIRSGSLSPRDVFRNDQRLLPKQGPGYYHEYVHPTPGISGAGPQRVVGGRGGELFYTPDHYKTFIPLN